MVGELRDRAFFVRHPVFSPRQKVAAFQLRLLGRVPGWVELTEYQQRAAMEEIQDIWSQIRWNRMLGNKFLLLPLPPALLVDELMRPLPPRKTIISLDWRLIQDLDWVNYLKKIRLFHFKVGVHNYDLSEPLPFEEYDFDYVTVDIQRAGPERIIHNMPQWHDKAHWIASRVNTSKQFDVCAHFGFRWFEGRFYLKPVAHSTQPDEPMKPSHVKVFQLLSRVDDPRLNLEEVALILEQDLVLSEQVVELVNATALRPGDEPISSILDAVRRLGVKKLKRWLETLVVGELGRGMPEVVRVALTRGAFMRCMGRLDPGISEEVYYTVGLFSVLDVIMKRPMNALLQALNLDDVIVAAILEKEGRPGVMLSVIEALETHDMDSEQPPHIPKGVMPAQINKCYLKALNYADTIMASLQIA